MSESACPDTWTAAIRTREGRLPDPRALARGLEALRVGARLRGVEVVVRGHLVWARGELRLRVSGTREIVRLSPLRNKVQWDVGNSRQEPVFPSEQSAWDRLSASRPQRYQLVEVTGPLLAAAAGQRPTLEVRTFDFLPSAPPRLRARRSPASPEGAR